ncbi:MAG TPA: PAS domain-containing protein [Actinomycetota bacterium]
MAWEKHQKDLVLILARDVAARLATPMFVVDANGTLVFFNEAAEQVLGQTFADTGELPVEEWASAFAPTDDAGQPIPLRKLPLGVALYEGRPDHATLSIQAADGVSRELAVTAIPLRTHPDELVGAVALFWSRSGPESALQ